VQTGTQSRSVPHYLEAIEYVRSGKLGKVYMAKAWNSQLRRKVTAAKDGPVPRGMDWNLWQGPAPERPYNERRHTYGWRWMWDYGTGDMGNDGVHDVDYTRWGLGVNTHPAKVAALGGKFANDDDQEFPDTQQVTFEYPGPAGQRKLLIYEQRLWSTNYPHNVDSGAEFYGTSGQMFLSRRGKLQVIDAQNKPVELKITPQRQDDMAHVRNFIAAIREGAKLNADALTGHLSTSLCHLGNIATRLGRSLDFDPQHEQILHDEEANRLLKREYRNHWGTPQGA
jgi:predicted dehydrogenase